MEFCGDDFQNSLPAVEKGRIINDDHDQDQHADYGNETDVYDVVTCSCITADCL